MTTADEQPKQPKQTLKREFWRPEAHTIWVKKQPKFGWGWTINFAEVKRRLSRRAG